MNESEEQELKNKLQATGALHGFLVNRLNKMKGLLDMMSLELSEAGLQYNLSHQALVEAMKLAGIETEPPKQEA